MSIFEKLMPKMCQGCGKHIATKKITIESLGSDKVEYKHYCRECYETTKAMNRTLSGFYGDSAECRIREFRKSKKTERRF
jgi:hypothetical protein